MLLMRIARAGGKGAADARDVHRLGKWGIERVRLTLMMLVMRIGWAGGLRKGCG